MTDFIKDRLPGNSAGAPPGGTPKQAAPTANAIPKSERDIDPRAAAKARADQLREHSGHDLDDGADEFYIDPAIIPDGWSYEWKAVTILGAENPGYQVHIARKGWEAVPAYRHPEMMPMGYKGASIDRKGMRLMERPKEITDDAVMRDKQRARDQVRQKEQQLSGAPPGTFERDNKGTPLATVRRSVEPMQIPK